MTLVVEDLRVEAEGREVVRGVSLEVLPGKVTAVLGANGAGKSELVLAIAGVLPSTSGRILLEAQTVEMTSPFAVRHAGIATVPEGHRVLSKLTVDDNLLAAGLPDPEKTQTMIAKTYHLFPELAERKQQLAGTLSGGQQQMLAIGLALMAQPRFLLIDEMSLGLAPKVVKRLVSAVEDLVAQGTGILLVEQFTEVALSLASKVVVMRLGEVQFSGSADDVKDDPTILDRAYF